MEYDLAMTNRRPNIDLKHDCQIERRICTRLDGWHVSIGGPNRTTSLRVGFMLGKHRMRMLETEYAYGLGLMMMFYSTYCMLGMSLIYYFEFDDSRRKM